MKARQKPGVVFQPEVHQALQRGIYQMVSALRPTLGPLANGVAIDNLNGTKALPEFLDDSGVIARRIIEIQNRDADMGAMLVRAMVLRQHEQIGDGTATTAVLFEAIFNAGVRYIAAGGNAMQLRRGLEKALPQVLDALDQMAFPLEGQQMLTDMARSLCHDDELAALLGEAFDLIGEYGQLEIREDYGRVLRREFVEGSYYHTGAFSRALLAQANGAGVTTLENPAIFLCDFEIEDHRELFPVLQTAYQANVPALVIITRSLSDKAISLLVAHNNTDRFKVLAVRLPGQNPVERMAALDDLSISTGAVPFIKVTGTTLENVAATHFGHARRVWADMDAFGLVGGSGSPRRLRQHIRILKAQYQAAEDNSARKPLQKRIGNLLGGSVTLHIGGFTEPEITTRKALAERTAATLRAAMESGVAPGGGLALLNCRAILQSQQAIAQDDEARMAYSILIKALAAPARTIFRNAGYDPSEVMAKLLQECPEVGFDVVKDRAVNLRECGILDSLVVLRSSVRNAVSTAALALTIDSLIHLSRPEMVGKPE